MRAEHPPLNPRSPKRSHMARIFDLGVFHSLPSELFVGQTMFEAIKQPMTHKVVRKGRRMAAANLLAALLSLVAGFAAFFLLHPHVLETK